MRGGLSGGATSADSKTIYPIDISQTSGDSVMYVNILERCYVFAYKAIYILLVLLWHGMVRICG